ncbi:TlpA disulfide reductase family protein [Botrimarina hoheduenensis]|nr:TlpA disulfide reductase family protein [Botrimarina hoheduenensis]
MSLLLRCLLSALPLLSLASNGYAAGAPTVEQALGLKPIQTGFQYDTPTADEAKRCSIKAVREGKSTSWVVRDAQDRVLRRFADANTDNVVDTWCYYAAGLEVYRDIDSDFDSKADQYRWFHTGGSRWGLDKNQDGKIDVWKQISPQEVAEEAVAAVKTRDDARFARLLLSSDEAARLGMGEALSEEVKAGLASARQGFVGLIRSQKILTGDSRFVDFGAGKPGVVPAGADGSTQDLVVYENATALIDNEGTPTQLLLGSLFRVGDGWRLVEAPTVDSSGPKLANVFSVPTLSGVGAMGSAPSVNTQALLAELEKLDQQSSSAAGAALDRLTDQRVDVLEKLASSAVDKSEQRQWYRQLADLLSASAQTGGYKSAVAKLAELERSTGVKNAGDDLPAHMRYKRIGAEYGVSLSAEKADYAKVQQEWLEKLEAFVDAYPKSEDAAESMLQLGHMAGEFTGETKIAERWYTRVAKEFPQSLAGRKASGALNRLNSVGKPIALRGTTLDGAKADLTSRDFRGKHVLIHYWASWSDPAEDMQEIAKLQQQYRGKLAVLGVNLDTSRAEASRIVTAAGVRWPQLHDERGLDGPIATDLGVMTLPLMMLVDDAGRVVNRNLYTPDLAAELKRQIR